jgi:hypothetical protein
MKSISDPFYPKALPTSTSEEVAIPATFKVAHCPSHGDRRPRDLACREPSMVWVNWSSNWAYPFLLLVILIAVNLIVFREFVFGDRLFIFIDIGSDTYASYYPIYYYFVEAIRNWDLSPYSYQLSLGNDILTIAYFLDLFFLPYLIVGSKSLAEALVYVAMLKILVAGLSMYAYLSYIGIPRFATLVCAIVFAFNGHMMLWGQHYFFASFVALMPLFFLAFERVYRESKWGMFVMVVAIMFPAIYLFLPVVFLFFFYSLFRLLFDRKVGQENTLSLISKKVFQIFVYGVLGQPF